MVKRVGRETEYSTASRPEGKNEWNCTSADPIHLYGVHRDTFTFTLTRGVTFNCFELCVTYSKCAVMLSSVQRISETFFTPMK